MPLTQEQFQKARSAGFSTDQIIAFEKRRGANVEPISQPEIPQSKPFVGDLLPKFSVSAPISDQTTITPQDIISGSVPLKGMRAIQTGLAERLKETTGANKLSDKPFMPKTGLLPTNPVNIGANLGASMATPRNVATGAIDILSQPETYMGLEALRPGIVSKPLQGLSELSGKILPETSPLKTIGKNISNIRNPIQLAQRVRQSMFGQRTQLGKALDESISKLSSETPDFTIDLSPHFSEMKEAMIAKDAEGNLINPGLRGDIDRILRQIKDPVKAKQLRSLINNPEGASELTLKQSEEIKKMVAQSPTIQRIYRQGRFANMTSSDHEVMDLLDNIKNTQAELFPELSELRKPYAEHMSAYNQVKGKFKEGTLIGKMRKGFGDEEVMKNVQKILPGDVLKEIAGFRRTGKALEWTGKT
ncbi:MAG: hypothetical protein HQK54_18405, partial [Oligoflexales bacterium]|nr:hypothetical protein [Oligoflexales bacterium]